ncbi:MAG: hypothetical protein LBV72_06805 [Tannerella sp.]|jgi:hypothetical protein|nr:hypothetical protein [Tannerella sp.]
MKSEFYLIVTVVLFLFSDLLPAQTHVRKTIPTENDQFTEYYILEENSDSTECYLYLFEPSHTYMLIANYHITPELTQSYFLSQGEYTNIDHQLTLWDDVNHLAMKAKQDEVNDFVFEQGFDFMTGGVFTFAEKTSQLPGPPYSYNTFSEDVIQAAIDQAKATKSDDNAIGYRYQTKIFSDQILADLQLNEDQTFNYQFMHYPLIQGKWLQENQLITLISESGTSFYGFIQPDLQNFIVIQLPGFIFEANDNHILYKVK